MRGAGLDGEIGWLEGLREGRVDFGGQLGFMSVTLQIREIDNLILLFLFKNHVKICFSILVVLFLEDSM